MQHCRWPFQKEWAREARDKHCGLPWCSGLGRWLWCQWSVGASNGQPPVGGQGLGRGPGCLLGRLKCSTWCGWLWAGVRTWGLVSLGCKVDLGSRSGVTLPCAWKGLPIKSGVSPVPEKDSVGVLKTDLVIQESEALEEALKPQPSKTGQEALVQSWGAWGGVWEG
jgi:hypothetical protein